MDHKDILKVLVRKKLRPSSRGSRGEEIYWNDLCDEPEFHPVSVDAAADKIERIDDLLRGRSLSIKGRGRKQIASPNIPLTTQDIFYGDELAKKITPWVEDIRQNIFGSPQAPFDWDGAIRWIEEEAREKYCEPVSEKLQAAVHALSAELRKHNINLTVSRDSLPYGKKNDEWQHSKYVNGPNMALLEHETRRMAKATGFNQNACVLFILAGLKPVVSRLKISRREHWAGLPNGEGLHRQELILTIRARDFTLKELQRIYDRMKKELTLIKKIPEASISEKRLEILRLVQEHGEPPARGKPGHWKFWQRVFNEWRKRHRRESPKCWQGLRDSWERSNKRLKNLL